MPPLSFHRTARDRRCAKTCRVWRRCRGTTRGAGDRAGTVRPTALATYGRGLERGVWAELTYNGAVLVHDRFAVDFDGHSPTLAILWFLAMFEFFSGDDVLDALAWLSGISQFGNFPAGPHGWPSRRRRPPSEGCGRSGGSSRTWSGREGDGGGGCSSRRGYPTGAIM